MVAIEFLDKNNKSILKAGYFGDASYYKYLEVVLEDNERIIGFKSGRRGDSSAMHFDF